jgi:hypothetical protein
MSALPRSYRTLEEFEREEIRPSFRIGFSIDDFEESAFEGELSFEAEAERESAELSAREEDDDEADDDDVDDD